MHDVDAFIGRLEREHGSPGWYSADGKLIFEHDQADGWSWGPLEEEFPMNDIDEHYQQVADRQVQTTRFRTRAQAARYAAEYIVASFDIVVDISSFYVHGGMFYTVEHGDYRVCFQRYPRENVWVVYRTPLQSTSIFDDEFLDSMAGIFCDELDVGVEHFPTLKAAVMTYLAVVNE